MTIAHQVIVHAVVALELARGGGIEATQSRAEYGRMEAGGLGRASVEFGAGQAERTDGADQSELLTAMEQALILLVNQQRADAGLPPLAVDRRLRAAALAHGSDMANRGYFQHDTPEGVTPWDRLRAAGVSWSAAGENIAKHSGGTRSARLAVACWMHSAPHRANILSKSFTMTGVGVAVDRRGNAIYTQAFIRPQRRRWPRIAELESESPALVASRLGGWRLPRVCESSDWCTERGLPLLLFVQCAG